MMPMNTDFFQRAPEVGSSISVGSLEWWNLGLQSGPIRQLDEDEVYTGRGSQQRSAADSDLDMQELQAVLSTLSPADPFTPQAALLSAAAQGDSPTVAEILKHHPEALPTVHNDQGLTAALLAAWGGHLSTLTVMIAIDSRCVYASDVHGHTAAHLAGWKGWDYIIKVLFSLDPKLLNGRTRRGSTPAHIAAASGQMNCVMTLNELAPGMLEVRDRCGYLPVDRCELSEPKARVMDAMGGEGQLLGNMFQGMGLEHASY